MKIKIMKYLIFMNNFFYIKNEYLKNCTFQINFLSLIRIIIILFEWVKKVSETLKHLNIFLII